jgi:hypothetical protein
MKEVSVMQSEQVQVHTFQKQIYLPCDIIVQDKTIIILLSVYVHGIKFKVAIFYLILC